MLCTTGLSVLSNKFAGFVKYICLTCKLWSLFCVDEVSPLLWLGCDLDEWSASSHHFELSHRLQSLHSPVYANRTVASFQHEWEVGASTYPHFGTILFGAHMDDA